MAISYWNILKDYEFQVVQHALMRTIKECKFFPKPAEILERIVGTKEENDEQDSMQAQRFWEWVIYELKRRGTEKPLKAEDRIGLKVLDEVAGGWISLGRKTEDQIVWIKKEFIKRYGELQRQFKKGNLDVLALPNGLPGHTTSHNDRFKALEHKDDLAERERRTQAAHDVAVKQT